MRQFISIIISSLIILSACSDKKSIVRTSDYDHFMKEGLVAEQVNLVNEELSFWQKDQQRDTGSYVCMLEIASSYLRRFKLTGNTGDLHKGDSLLKRSSAKLADTDPDILFALSQNSITQHQFRDAARYTEAAAKRQGDPFITTLLRFDAGMELGNYSAAFSSLNSLKDKTSFDYLVRKAKMQDHQGDLDGAILSMEEAFEKIKNRKKSLYCWTLSNLGDMYGHAGRVKESYDAYIKVLQKDNGYIYALKGIAWIAYAHDGNTKESKRILHFLLSQTMAPDHYLTLAEIAEAEGNENLKEQYTRQFLTQVAKPGYGDMYNKYLIQLYTDELQEYDKAMLLAQKEVTNRATPETYDWLAWVHYVKGEKEKAFMYASNYVFKRNYEPDALFHTAVIFAANGKTEQAKNMLKECLESSFEMGPIKTKKVKEELLKLQ